MRASLHTINHVCSISCVRKADDIRYFAGKSFNKFFFEDTKGVIRSRKWKKDRQHNGQEEKYKRTRNDLQNIT